jgi:hypothetical protein
LDAQILGGVVLDAVGVLGFGTVVGWWAVSLIGQRRPSPRAVSGVIAGVTSTTAVVALLAGPGRLVPVSVGAAVAATTEIVFFAATVRQLGSKGAG